MHPTMLVRIVLTFVRDAVSGKPIEYYYPIGAMLVVKSECKPDHV